MAFSGCLVNNMLPVKNKSSLQERVSVKNKRFNLWIYFPLGQACYDKADCEDCIALVVVINNSFFLFFLNQLDDCIISKRTGNHQIGFWCIQFSKDHDLENKSSIININFCPALHSK